jgi:hypothetical protein
MVADCQDDELATRPAKMMRLTCGGSRPRRPARDRRAAPGADRMRVRGSIRWAAVLVGALRVGGSHGRASEHEWTVVTLARNGSWGVAKNVSQGQALAAAMRDCNAMAASPSDCGALSTAARGEWIIAKRCGDHNVVVSGTSFADAEKAALYREIDLQISYVPDLPPCMYVATVDPAGNVIPQTALQRVSRNAADGN